MRFIDKKLLCMVSSVFYAVYVIHSNLTFRYSDLFAGVDYNGYELFYATTIYLFAIVLFFGFGDTEKYIGGYGILEVTRSTKRKDIVRKIVIRQAVNLLELLFMLIGSYSIVSALLGKKDSSLQIREFLLETGMFYIVCLSILLWQVTFEVLFDSRIAIVIMMSMIGIHLYIGDYVINNGWNKSIILLFYSNLALSIRSERLEISRWAFFMGMFFVCLVQIIILNAIYKRKDIIST